MAQTHCVIFDLGGVLINLDMEGCAARFRALGMRRADPDLLGRYERGLVGSDEFLAALAALCAPGTDTESVRRAWVSCLLDIPAERLALVERLRARGYATCLLSNINDIHWSLIEREKFPAPPERYFDRLFLSHELHMAKPDPEVFRRVTREAGHAPAECLFVDDLPENCAAARAVGLRALRAEPGSDFAPALEAMLRDGE